MMACSIFFYRVDKGQLFATKYKLILPSAQELQDEADSIAEIAIMRR